MFVISIMFVFEPREKGKLFYYRSRPDEVPQSKVPKYLSDTRWEAHAKAIEAVLENYNNIIDALNQIISDFSFKGDARKRAENIVEKMEEFEFVFMLYFWNRVLSHFHKVNKAIQKSNLLLSTCANLYGSLQDILYTIREDFDKFEEQAKITLPNVDYKRAKRIRKTCINRGNYESASGPDALDDLSSRDKFRIKTFIPILDKLEADLRTKATVYNDFAKMFSFLIDLTLSKNEIQKNVELLMDSHPKDVNLKLTDELFHFHLYVRQNHKPTDMHCVSHLDLYQIIHKENIEMAFPNVELILRIFLILLLMIFNTIPTNPVI